MNRLEEWLEKARDFWELATLKFKRHQSIYYQGVFAFTVVFYVAMFGSGIVLTKPNDLKTAEIGTELRASTLNFKLLGRSYNQDKGLMELLIVGESENPNFKKMNLKFDILVKGMEEGTATLKIVEGERNFFAVYVQNLPKNWEGVMVNITEMSDGNSSKVSFVTGGKSIDGSKNTSIRNEQEVKVESIEYQIGLRKSERKAKEKEIKTIQKEIKELNSEIKALEDDLDYQTDKQVELTKTTINGLKETINQKNSTISSIELEVVEIEKRIEKLNLKKQDIEK